MIEVSVTATWRSGHTFEFDTEDEAQAFADAVNGRSEKDGLEALIEAGDVDSSICELIDFEARDPR